MRAAGKPLRRLAVREGMGDGAGWVDDEDLELRIVKLQVANAENPVTDFRGMSAAL